MLIKHLFYLSRKRIDRYFPRHFMATFTSRTNIVTGMNDWIFVDDEKFDYQQELARSAFADMLHDHERNVQYEKAIRKTIGKLGNKLKSVHVLDIGTGTGLLSMMSARAWNQLNQRLASSFRITACEVFQPMAKIAQKCIEKNGFAQQIRVIDKRSTELKLNEDFHGDQINMIVAEVFDTELIGEGALRTFTEACKHLTVDRENLRIVPARATIYIQMVESTMLADFHRMKDLSATSKRVIIPDDCRSLAGNTIFDLNVNEIRDAIRPLSKAIPVFHFDFKSLDETNNFIEEKLIENLFCEIDGRIDAFVMWWSLDMDEDGEIKLATTPIWCDDLLEPKDKEIQWREHWIHGIFFPQTSIVAKANEKLNLYCFHDEYSLYFDVNRTIPLPRSYPPSIISRSAMAAFNSDQRRDSFIRALDSYFSSSPTMRCLYMGDSLLLPLLILERYSQVELTILESSNPHLNNVIKAILSNSSSELKYRMVSSLDSEMFDFQSIDMIVSEPFFTTSILPWDNLHFYYLIQQNRMRFRPDCRLFPSKARIRCLPLEFNDLHKIRLPVQTCCGFDLTPFDEQIMAASLEVDEPIEPQPLFEYSSKQPALSTIVDLLDIDFQEDFQDRIEKKIIDIKFTSNGTLNGIAFWIDYQLSETIWLTTGLDNQRQSWVPYSKQGVHLLPKPLTVELPMKISINTGFDFKQGQFLFSICRDDKILGKVAND